MRRSLLICNEQQIVCFLCLALLVFVSCSQKESKSENEKAIPFIAESKGVVIQPNEREKLVFRAPPSPDSVSVIISPENGASRFAMGTQNLPVDYLVPMHKHEQEDEILFFHKGHSHASVGDETVEVEPGTTVFIPHGVWHSIHNTSDEPAQMVWFVSKPGLEDFFREGSVLPGEPWTPLTNEEIDSIGRKHGVIFAPDKNH